METVRFDVTFTKPDGKVTLLTGYRYYSAAINCARIKFHSEARQRGFVGWYVERITFENRKAVRSVVLARSVAGPDVVGFCEARG